MNNSFKFLKMQKIKGFEKADLDNDVYIDDIQITYCQVGDCTEDRDDVQTLTLSARNNGCARFINIKTENWSIDSPDEFSNIVRDFEKRADMHDVSEVKENND